ncbi:hypothetical protein AB0L82_43525 [Nocardia sp. NPDC052001]
MIAKCITAILVTVASGTIVCTGAASAAGGHTDTKPNDRAP